MTEDRLRLSNLDRGLAVLVGALWSVTVVCWLVDVAGGGVAAVVAQSAILMAIVVTALGGSRLLAGLWRQTEGETVWSSGRILILLVGIAMAIHWIGIDWEVTGRYYRDEGIYYAAANDINEGQLFPKSFIYGHLPYYLYAFALWVQSLFPNVMAWFAGHLFGVRHQVDVSWILLRGINTTLGALTTIPVFVIAQRVAGRAAAVIGAILIIFSPLYNEITRLIISDVPSAFFAAMCLMFVARLLDEERYGPYLMAGVAAALAAASKYPSGVVVAAILGIWIAWRIETRRWSWHLMAAGAVSLLTFLTVMPAFWAHSDAVFVGQGKDLLFGFRQYGRGGWIGVMPTSNARWYGEQLLTSFGVPVVALGLLGWIGLDRDSRRRFYRMLPFPVIFLALMAAMSMVVKRNLLPVLPALAALLGVGMAGGLAWFHRRSPPQRRRLYVGVLAVALVVPVYRTTVQTIAFARPSTREEAAAWIEANVPRGAAIIKESYTPHLHKKKYAVHQTRFAPRLPMEEIRNGEWDYLLLAKNAYGRFLEPQNWTKPHHEYFAKAYEEMLQFDQVRVFAPSRTRMGPTLELYAIDPPDLEYRDRYRFTFEDEGFRYPRDDAYLLLKEHMEAGRYSVILDTDPPAVAGRVRVVSRDNREAEEVSVVGSRGTVELPWRSRYFFYLYLPKDTEIRAMELVPIAGGS